MFIVYVLKSKRTNRRYVGYTNNIQRRLKEHNSGRNPSTKGFAPYELKYTETFENLDEALKRENFLKTGVGREFLNGIIK